jgi:hypothetical protein
VSHVEKLQLRFLHNEKLKLLGSGLHVLFWRLLLYKISVEFNQKSINTKELFSLKFLGFFTFLADLAYDAPVALCSMRRETNLYSFADAMVVVFIVE